MAMDSSSAQSHHQEVGSQTLESMLASTKAQQEKKPRPADQQSLKCPRCESTNTKFCYYNNYSLSQPRYFCKSCRRYWTKGGTLRNVPVGGGCRKAKRSSSSSSSRRNPDHPSTITSPLPAPAPIPSYAAYDARGHLGLDDVHAFPLGDCGLVDALRGGFLEVPRFQNLYNADGNGNNEIPKFLGLECGAGMGMGMGIGVLNQEMGFEEFVSGGGAPGTTSSSTTVKQELMCSNGDKWGLPWQNVVGGDGTGHGGRGDLDSTRIGSWNGIGSSTWHGLLNTPLM